MIGKKYEYDAMAACEQHLWWYRSLHALTFGSIKKHVTCVNPRLLDAGCGTGGLILFLQKKGFRCITGFDLSADAVAWSRQATSLPIDQADITLTANRYPAANFDVIVSHDILCLLPADAEKKALQQLLQVLKPGGFLLMNFPAGKAFRGTHDIAVGIQRRYSQKMVEQLVGDAAVIKNLIYWPFLLSPLIFAVRTVQRLTASSKNVNSIVSDVKMPPAFLNNIFGTITAVENRLLPSKPWGSSLFVIIQKPL